MKKSIIIIALVFLAMGATVKAQDSVMVATTDKPDRDFPRAEFGFRFMPTISSFDMQTSSGGTVKGEATLGYGAGVFLGINLSNHVGLVAEVMYNSLSQKYKDQELDREINVQYINIPLLVSLNTGKANPVNLKIEAGPQIGYNIGASVSSSGDANSDTLQTVLTTKKSDFGFAYGAGLEFVLNKNKTIRMDLGFRGVYGFVNISNTSQTQETDSYYILDRATIRTNAGYVGLTVLF